MSADNPRQWLHAKCDCVPDLGPPHCHHCSVTAEVPWGGCAAVGVEVARVLREFAQELRQHARFPENQPGAGISAADALEHAAWMADNGAQRLSPEDT